MMPYRFLRIAGLFVALAAMALPQGHPAPKSPAFTAFMKSVQQYLKLHNDSPRLRTTRQRGEIVDRRSELKEHIREARGTAKPGDIFTSAIADEIRLAITSAFRGPDATNVRKTIQQGDPVKGWSLSINGDYPDLLPLTTVPPTLLLQLPQLPPGVAYRIIGHDFVLEDTQARLIVDFIPGALP